MNAGPRKGRRRQRVGWPRRTRSPAPGRRGTSSTRVAIIPPEVERQTGVDYVLHDQDVPAGDLGIEVLEQPDARVTPGIGSGGVARQLEEVDAVRNVERPREVGQEHEARLERRDQERFPAGVVARDLASELADARLQLITAEVNVPETRVRGEWLDRRHPPGFSPAIRLRHPASSVALGLSSPSALASAGGVSAIVWL